MFSIIMVAHLLMVILILQLMLLITPDPLEHGRAYYFAIWEWNESGIDIIGSSNISYFIVSP